MCVRIYPCMSLLSLSLFYYKIDTKETDKKTKEKPVEKSGTEHNLRCVLYTCN